MASAKNILLVDDDADDQLLFTDALKEIDSEIRCTIAHNGKDALEQLRNFSHLPDILFLDLNMPFINGYEFLKHLKREIRLREIPVVIFTTSNERKDAELAHRLGADLFFSKPNEFSKLRMKLTYILSLEFKKQSSFFTHFLI